MKTTLVRSLLLISFISSCSPFGQVSVVKIDAPDLEWDTTSFDYGSLSLGSSSSAIFTLTNQGKLAATQCGSIALSDTTNFSVLNDECSLATMASGQQCEVEVASHPTTVGVKNLTITRACANGVTVSTATDQIVATGVTASMGWDVTGHNFGNQYIGTNSSSIAFTLVNNGAGDATGCSTPVLTDNTNFTITANTCGTAPMASGSSCIISVRANPASVGNKSTTLSRTCTTGGTISTLTNQIRVTGQSAILALTPSTYNFGSVNVAANSSTQTFTINNTGTADATGCSSPSITNGANFFIVGGTCGTNNVVAGSSCTIDVRGTPVSTGTKYATLSRTCTQGGSVATTTNGISMTAVTPSAPNLAWSPLSHDFGSVDIGQQSLAQTFTLSNSGNANATGCGTPTITDVTNFAIVSNNCGATLNQGASCEVQIVGQPSMPSSYGTTLSQTCSVGGTVATYTNQIYVTGTTPAPNLYWDNLTYNYGAMSVGSSATHTFTLSNSGSVDASGCSAATISDTTNYTITSDTCGTSDLAASGGTCTINVRTNPTTAGVKQATLQRICSVGGTVATNTNGISTTATGPTLAWSTSSYDYGDVHANDGSLPTTITLTNSGNGAAASCSAPILSDSTNFSITEDNCGTANLNASATCTVKVQANPITAGAKVTALSRTCTVGGTVTTGNGIIANGISMPANTIMKVVGGAHHTCAMTFDGTVKCWGTSSSGQMGYNELASRGHTADTMSTLPAVFLGTGKSARDIAAGYSHTCAILNDHTMKCWGENGMGQLGTGDNTKRGDVAGSMEALNPINVGVGRLVKKMSTGYQHTCAILDNDTVKCWGRNFIGALGMGSVGDLNAPAANPINFGSNTVKEVAAGYIYTCFILNTNVVRCTGENSSGQLGYDNTSTYSYPGGDVNLGAGRTAKKLAAGYGHMCAILDDNSVKCWGSNSIGQSGVESASANFGHTAGSMATLTPVILGAGRTAKAISAKIHHTCALLDDDTVKCWGHNAYGQLGYDDTTNRGIAASSMQNLLPVNLGVGRTASGVMAGPFHSCAVLDNNTVKCWGNNSTGRLGYGDTSSRGSVAAGFSIDELLAINVGPSLTVKNFAVGNGETCAIMSDDSLKCWGSNWNGKLGYNDTTDRGKTAGSMAALPSVYLGVGRTAVKVSIGWHHTCAILDNGAVKCWGYNNYGQLGTNDTTARGNVPGSMEALGEVYLGVGRTAVDIYAGYQHSCAHLDDGNVKCWGWNVTGQLGQNDKSTRGASANSMQNLQPIYLGVGRTVTSFSGGWTHNCMILDNNELKCFGSNGTGELGYDETDPFMGEGQHGGYANSMQNLAAINVGAGRYAVSVSAGQQETCAVLDDGSAKCWGHGLQGNLGTGTSTTYGKLPGDMAALPTINLGAGRTAQKISAGYAYTCALLDNNTSKCWGGGGMSSINALGYNNTSQIYAPIGAIEFRSGLTVKKIAASLTSSYGYAHTCAILSDDSLACWGDNSFGELGLDDMLGRGYQGYSITNTKPHGFTP